MLSFKIDGEAKTFQEKHKLRQFMTANLALQKDVSRTTIQRKKNISISKVQEIINFKR